MTIGQKLKEIRKQDSLKQGVVAKALGISQTYLSQVESGKRNPSTSLLDRMAAYYSMPLPVLIWAALTEDDVTPNKREFYKSVKPIVDAIVKELFTEKKRKESTCSSCGDNKTCEFAFDGYNTNGDCLAIK